MKKFVLVFLVISSIVFKASAQKTGTPASPPKLPLDSITKLITYDGIVQVPNMKADALYKRAESWFKTYYKNPSEVIRESDSLKFKITGKPRFKIYNLPDKD